MIPTKRPTRKPTIRWAGGRFPTVDNEPVVYFSPSSSPSNAEELTPQPSIRWAGGHFPVGYGEPVVYFSPRSSPSNAEELTPQPIDEVFDDFFLTAKKPDVPLEGTSKAAEWVASQEPAASLPQRIYTLIRSNMFIWSLVVVGLIVGGHYVVRRGAREGYDALE